jgi:sterol regulatory element-binding transcription factor 1
VSHTKRSRKDGEASVVLKDAIEELAENSKAYGDETSFWWSQCLKVGFSWLTGDESTATDIILRLPDSLKNNSLAISLLLSGKLKRFIYMKNPKENRVIRNLLDRASYELWRSIEVNEASRIERVRKNDCTQQILEAFQLLACEWLLSSRVALWEQNKGTAGAPVKEVISGFRRDLSTLRYLIQFIPNAKTKLYLFEGSYRLITNSNPLIAQSMFERALRKRRNGGSAIICTGDEKHPMSLSDQSDVASALLQMGKHLPSQLFSGVGEREGYIREAHSLLGRHMSDKKLIL